MDHAFVAGTCCSSMVRPAFTGPRDTVCARENYQRFFLEVLDKVDLQKKLIARMRTKGSKFSKAWWLSMFKILEWLDPHCTEVQSSLQWQNIDWDSSSHCWCSYTLCMPAFLRPVSRLKIFKYLWAHVKAAFAIEESDINLAFDESDGRSSWWKARYQLPHSISERKL